MLFWIIVKMCVTFVFALWKERKYKQKEAGFGLFKKRILVYFKQLLWIDLCLGTKPSIIDRLKIWTVFKSPWYLSKYSILCLPVGLELYHLGYTQGHIKDMDSFTSHASGIKYFLFRTYCCDRYLLIFIFTPIYKCILILSTIVLL